MPIHLLHHKSYHVYRADNIARVKRDEAAHEAAQTLAIARADAAAAEHRLALLRARAAGQTDPATPTPTEIDATALPCSSSTTTTTTTTAAAEAPKRDDDPIEVASAPPLLPPRKPTQQDLLLNRTGLVGPDGHINLFPEPSSVASRKVAKNAEAEAERRAAEKKIEAQWTMTLERPADPWYVGGTGKHAVEEALQDREKRREERRGRKMQELTAWRDPLAAMKVGLRKTKEVEERREDWRRERERDVTGAGEKWVKPVFEENDERSERMNDDRARRRSKDRGHDRTRRRTDRDRSRSPRPSRSSRHHRSRHHKHSSSKTPSSPSYIDANDELSKLRAAAAERERIERARTDALRRAEKDAETPAWQPAVPGGRYSCQFGAGVARR